MVTTTISLDSETYDELAKRKIHKNQSFDEVVRGLLGLPINEPLKGDLL